MFLRSCHYIGYIHLWQDHQRVTLFQFEINWNLTATVDTDVVVVLGCECQLKAEEMAESSPVKSTNPVLKGKNTGCIINHNRDTDAKHILRFSFCMQATQRATYSSYRGQGHAFTQNAELARSVAIFRESVCVCMRACTCLPCRKKKKNKDKKRKREDGEGKVDIVGMWPIRLW